MQFFPRDRDGLASLQVLYAAGYFFVPSRLNGLLRFFETVEQGVGQCRALVDRARFKRSETSGLMTLFYLWISAANIFFRPARNSFLCSI
jgi:hypothetical protein